MRVQITRAPDSQWFAYWRPHPKAQDIRDLGDFCFWFIGFEITIWWHPPYYFKKVIGGKDGET